MVHHVVEGHGNGVGLALHDHAHRVADQDDVDTGKVDQASERDVVGGDHRDLLAEGFHARQLGNGDLGPLMRLAGHEAVASLNRGDGVPDAEVKLSTTAPDPKAACTNPRQVTRLTGLRWGTSRGSSVRRRGWIGPR